MSYPGTPDRIELAGSGGSAVLERYRVRAWLRDGTVIDETESGGGDARPGGRDYLAHTRIIADMLDALDQGRAPLADGRSALHVHRLIDGLLRSNGTEVRL